MKGWTDGWTDEQTEKRMPMWHPATSRCVKNDSSVVIKSLNLDGPLGSYVCDIILPAFLIMCQFLEV